MITTIIFVTTIFAVSLIATFITAALMEKGYTSVFLTGAAPKSSFWTLVELLIDRMPNLKPISFYLTTSFVVAMCM